MFLTVKFFYIKDFHVPTPFKKHINFNLVKQSKRRETDLFGMHKVHME